MMAEELTVAEQMAALSKELTQKFDSNIAELQSKYDTKSEGYEREISLLKAGKDPKSTEIQETKSGLESQYAREDAVKAAAQALTNRDAFWEARNKAIYEDKLPVDAFIGFTTVEEITRQTAVLNSFKGRDQEKTDETIGGGSKKTPVNNEKLTGLDAAEAFMNARND